MHPAALIGRKARRLTVGSRDRTVDHPLVRVREVVCVGGRISLSARRLLLRRNVGLSLFTASGRYCGRLAPRISGEAGLRLAQDAAACDPLGLPHDDSRAFLAAVGIPVKAT
jgi:CRISPR/Cas system-associated endonuclease Cas1